MLGPETYWSTTGKPDVYTDAFPALMGQGILLIQNDEVRSALIWINGQLVLGTEDFSQKVSSSEVPICLLESNSIKVELRSGPNSSLFIEVRQEIETGGAGQGLYVPKKGDTKFGFNLDFGLDYQYNNFSSIEFGVNFHKVFDSDVQFLQCHVGLIFHF